MGAHPFAAAIARKPAVVVDSHVAATDSAVAVGVGVGAAGCDVEGDDVADGADPPVGLPVPDAVQPPTVATIANAPRARATCLAVLLIVSGY
jgi:hypothetical protein